MKPREVIQRVVEDDVSSSKNGRYIKKMKNGRTAKPCEVTQRVVEYNVSSSKNSRYIKKWKFGRTVKTARGYTARCKA